MTREYDNKEKKLMHIGEQSLRAEIEEDIKKVFECINFLADEELDLNTINNRCDKRLIDINRYVSLYLDTRGECVSSGLDPSQYDYRVQNAVRGIDYLESKLQRKLGLKGEN